MPGYHTKQERVAVAGADALIIRSLLDRQQYHDPLGAAERIGISSAAWPLFGLLWPSGEQLAACMAARPLIAGERILEVGCGLALASLVGHRRGADVTASDCHPLTDSFLRENLLLNKLAPMKYLHGDWSAEPHGTQAADHACAVGMQGQYDLIMGSDLLYERDENANLARFIRRHAAPSAEVWIIDPDRGNRPAFNRQMADRGFALKEQSLNRKASQGVIAYKGRLLVYRCAAPARGT